VNPDSRRPRLALPFAILPAPGVVRLVAGEDVRFTLRAEGLDRWLPGLLSALDGCGALEDALSRVEEEFRPAARRLVDRLYGERVLVEGRAAAPAAVWRIAAEGRGPLLDGLSGGGDGRALAVLCQDRLDYDEARRFNRRALDGRGPWMWATIGPLARGYVSPVFLPTSGPCLDCLLRQFRRRSPAGEVYDALDDHAKAGGALPPAPFPGDGVEILRRLILRKAAMLADPLEPAAPYRLHVLEVATLEVTAHRVFLDPECGACQGRRR
jgi:bacteriocin biosynthesis cyclodehydratase domain-containing protein